MGTNQLTVEKAIAKAMATIYKAVVQEHYYCMVQNHGF
jgi:hypothetical protein